MIERAIAAHLKAISGRFPVVTLTGPRQSGKTTLVRTAFPDAEYVSLEEPDVRSRALEDPRGFLARFRGPSILDEAHRAPDLFSYLQGLVDRPHAPGPFVLTGSHNFLLLEQVSQSLAGRAAVLHLLPLSVAELARRPPLPLETLAGTAPAGARPLAGGLLETLWKGFYPRIHDRAVPPVEWFGSYVQTYLERDVRVVLNVGDLETFGRFLRLCAGRSGQILDLTSLASDAGVSHTTARRWLSVLEASFLVVLLRPYHRNFGKRLVKNPKLYFLDTGLLCYLLRIRSSDDLDAHASRGAIFESFVLAELYKNFVHRGQVPDLSFWRDSNGLEVDFLVEVARGPIALEAKSGLTVAEDFFRGLEGWRRAASDPGAPGAVVYGGDEAFARRGFSVRPWYAL